MKRNKKPAFEEEEIDDIAENVICEGFIKSTEFIQRVHPYWNVDFLSTDSASMVAKWCIAHFEEYGEAPGKEILPILYAKVKQNKVSEDVASDIESDILTPLNDVYDDSDLNLKYVLKSTREYFVERQIELLNDDLTTFVAKGKTDEAVALLNDLKLISDELEVDSSETSMNDTEKVSAKLDAAFDTSNIHVVNFHGALGEFMNPALVEEALVGILARDKMGKTFFLLELMITAARNNVPVAFFQAGDMTEAQQLVRIAVRLAGKSDKEEYTKQLYIPVKDCIRNQSNQCTDQPLRTCRVNLELTKDEGQIREQPMSRDEMITSLKEHPNYKPCIDCSAYHLSKNRWSTSYLKRKKKTTPLGKKEAKAKVTKFFKNKQVKLSSHANGTLTLSKIRNILDKWDREDNFKPKLVLVDYGDLLVPETKIEFRHQQDYIWRGLRGLSQKTKACWVVPTQADADSYEQKTLTSKNFSEDKRKNAHVTAMFGLNQDKDGLEKGRGVMRINKLVFRDGDFHPSQQVHVLQSLATGRPVLDSYF